MRAADVKTADGSDTVPPFRQRQMKLTVCGGEGSDTLAGGGGNQRLLGGGGPDNIQGWSGQPRLFRRTSVKAEVRWAPVPRPTAGSWVGVKTLSPRGAGLPG